MRRIVHIFGTIGAGKSSLIRRVIAVTGGLAQWIAEEPEPLVRGHRHVERDLFLIGRYDDQQSRYPGLDRLAQNVQPGAEKFVREIRCNVILEGDKLTNMKWMTHLFSLPSTDVSVLFLRVDPIVVSARREERGDDRPLKFIQSRETKYRNIVSTLTTHYPSRLTILDNDTMEQQNAAFDHVTRHLGIGA